MRRWFRRLHLWLGITIALPVILTAGTGIVLTWAKELAPVVEGPEWAAAEGREALDWPQLVASIYATYPEARLLHVGGDPRGGYALQVWLDRPDLGVRAFLLDPATGRLTARQPEREWLKWIEALHRNLLLGPVGRQVVAVSSIAMVVIALLGVILWWPMRRGTLRGLLARRAVLRWHNLLGLSALPLLLVFSLTGITLTYHGPLFDALHWLAGSSPEGQLGNRSAGAEEVSLDTLFATARAAISEGRIRGVNESKGEFPYYEIRFRQPGDLHPSGWQWVRVDAGTGELLAVEDKSNGSWVSWYEEMWYVLHTGSFLGPVARGIWALASLGILVVAVTGVWRWVRRQRRI